MTDNINPTAICQNLTVQLDANGAAVITPNQVDNGSFDNCAIDTIYLDDYDFNCADVGSNTVTFTVVDVNGNVSTCTSTITVQDNINPTAICQNLTVQLDANGAAVITAAQVDNGSFDNCAIDTIYLDDYDFNCADVGSNTVTLTVVDVNGNVSTCTSTITVNAALPANAGPISGLTTICAGATSTYSVLLSLAQPLILGRSQGGGPGQAPQTV